MNKSLYSLMLMDSVVAQIDRAAARAGTSRSNMVNQILAEYVEMLTPEKRIAGIFDEICSLISNEEELIPTVTPHRSTMFIKTPLEYKYRPTVKYEVQLSRGLQGAIGELSVLFRTRSEELIEVIDRFLNVLAELESRYLPSMNYPAPRYKTEGGRFSRSLFLPEGTDSDDEKISKSISDYVRMFDDMLKGTIDGRYPTAASLEHRYVQCLNEGVGLI